MDVFEPLCLNTEASEELTSELAAYADARALYRQQDWHGAAAAFDQLCAAYPAAIYRIYRSRIDELQGQTLPAAWDGVYRHMEK